MKDKIKRENTEWKKTFANHTLNNIPASRTYKELPQFNDKCAKNPLTSNKWPKYLNRYLSNKICEWLIRTQKYNQHYLSSGKCKSKSTMRYHHIPNRVPLSTIQTISSVRENEEK